MLSWWSGVELIPCLKGSGSGSVCGMDAEDGMKNP